ncbi:MAG: hypothetical protein PHY48_16390, partial [Candidatus Cloacimonetes bacterium]|nr:hypothetical protein [Candidatus Cloacimonadota bacterium]
AEPYYSWSAKAGVCEIPEGQPSEGSDLSSVTYRTPDKEQCSELYLDQTVSVDVSPIGSVSSNLFTVVKVDVEIGCVDDEALEESVGAFVKLDINDYNGREYDLYDMGWLKSVSITCEPEDLPEEEIVSISCDGVLYELKDDGKLYVAADEYVAASVKDRTFYLQGKSVSGDLADKEITVTHDTSKAVDKAKFTVVAVVVEPINKTYKNKACLTNSAADFYGAEFIMPDALMSNMTWNVDYGYVEIISQREKTAYVQANALGAFTVTLDVDKSDTRFSTYDLPSPYINGEVVEEVVVPVHFIIASDGVTTVSVPSLQEVNQRFSQVGMRFYVASCSTNQSEDALWIRSDKPDDELKNVFTNNFSGILVYCIDSFDGPPDDDDDDDDEEDEFDIGERGGMTYSSSSGYHGIVLSRHDHLCLSHEVGHYCGLLDILHSENGDAGRPLTDEENIVRIGRVRIGDWSGGVASGYYSHGINMRNIISRLMMNQQSSFGPDIPLSSTVHGLNVDNDDYGPVNVGYEAMNRNLQTAVPPWSFWPIF